MTFSLRLATKEDISILIEFRIEFLKEFQTGGKDEDLDIFREHLGNYFRKHMNDTFLAWLAVDDENNIIATSGLAIIVKPPHLKNFTGKESYIMNMYTLPNWRRKGIGSALLEKLLEESKTRGINRVSLFATPTGRTLYEKYDFKTSEDFMNLRLE